MVIPAIKLLELDKDSKYAVFRDVTGAYNTITNPGGYGTPNAAAPTKVGFTWRYWPDTLPYINASTSNSTLISELLSSDGHKFTCIGVTGIGSADDLNIDKFKDGVHHVKYYPFELTDATVTLTQGSKTITITAGTFDPTAVNAGYMAILILDGSSVIQTTVRLMADKPGWTSTTLTMDTAWTASTVTGYKLMIAPEGDLKFVVKNDALNCISRKVGRLAQTGCCERKVIEKLTDLTMWTLSASVKLQCSDFQGAHDFVTSALKECQFCISEDCSTCI